MKIKIVLAILCAFLAMGCPGKLHKTDEGATASTSSAANPSAIQAYARGNYLLEQGDYPGAEKAFEEALSADPGSVKIKAKLVDVYAAQLKLDKAYVLAKEIYPSFKDDPNFLLTLAKLEGVRGNLEDALKHLETAASLAPENIEVLFMLWRMQAEVGLFDDALKTIDRIGAIYPDAIDVVFWRALVHEAQGKRDEAKKDYEKCLEMEPGNTSCMNKLGYLALSRQEADAARKYFGMVLDIDPGNAEALEGLSILDGGQIAGPVPGGVEALGLQAAISYIEKNEFEKALLELASIREKHPNNLLILFLTALCYDGLGQLDRAAELYVQVPKSSRIYPEARFRYALVLARQKKYDEAKTVCEQLLLEFPQITEAAVLLSNIYVEQGDANKAVELLEPVAETYPENEPVSMSLAAAYYEVGRYDESVEMMSRILAKNPDNADALNFLGYSFVEKGERLDEAELMILKAMKLKPGSAAITDSLGWLFYAKGDFKKAAVILETAFALDPDDPTIGEHLADSYVKTDRKKEALETYKKALANCKKKDQKERIEKKLKELE